MKTTSRGTRKFLDGIQYAFVGISAFICVFALFYILYFVLSRGLAYVDWNFLTSTYSPRTRTAAFCR